MQSTAVQMRQYRGVAILSFGFRPFFLGGAVFAALIPLATVLSLIGFSHHDAGISIIAWHAHEMIYGFLAAVVAGFVLTAVPNWTGRLPIMGWRLGALFFLWLAGRLVMAVAPGETFSAFIDIAFLIVLNAFVWREIIKGKNWRNAPVCIFVGILAAGNLIWHLDVIGGGQGGFGQRLGIAAVALLLALIGGRVTPSFTRNWFAKNSHVTIDASLGAVDKIALALVITSLAVWLAWPIAKVSGVFLGIAGLALSIRLLKWKGWRTLREPLVTILHIGYLWLALGFALLGAAVLVPRLVSTTVALHALAAGAAGVMTLAIMTRATLGHTGRALTADCVTLAIYLLVNIGAVLRRLAPSMPMSYQTVLAVSAITWGAAFLVFAIYYGKYLVSPRLSSGQAQT